MTDDSTQPQTLDYSTSPPPRRRLPWLVLIGMAAVIGVVFWSLADWTAYVVDRGPGWYIRRPKFDWPLWFQALESSAVGAVATALLYGLYRLGRWWLG